MKNKQPIAIAAADIHLSSRPPLFRSVEEDWMSTQAGYLKQMRKQHLVQKVDICNRSLRSIPALIAGDLFDRCGVPPHIVTPEVISLAMRELPSRTYAIAGNHDLPSHRLEEQYRSAYGILQAANRLININPHDPLLIEDGEIPLRIHGFPCGVDVQPLEKPHDMYLEIALIHSYVWTQSTGYPGAPDEFRLGAYKKKLRNYDVVIFGDNHIPIDCNLDRLEDGPAICNVGGFMVRKSDERNHKPSVAAIYADGTIERRYLDISTDKYADVEETVQLLDALGMNSFTEALLDLGDASLDFAAIMQQLLQRGKVDQRVKDLVLRSLNIEDK